MKATIRDVVPQIDARALRDKVGLTQAEFWPVVGVTQSGGSRYESGRRMPVMVKAMLAIAFMSERDAKKVISVLRQGR